MNNNARENDIKRAHLVFLIINFAFSILLIRRILIPPVWELWFIPIVMLMGVSIWIVYYENMFSLKARTLLIAGTSLVFLYYYGCHYEVLHFEFPLCIIFFTTACSALDEHSLTYAGFFGYFLVLFYHVMARQDISIIPENYLAIVVMFTVLFYSRFLIGKHSKELAYFDESIDRIEEERKSREDFLANVSHELRTPVNAIMGMADILLKKDLEEDVRDEIYSIENAGYRLSNQIDDIMDFSEIISGSLVDESETYFFSDLIRDFKAIYNSIGRDEDTKIEWDISSQIPSVLLGDKKKIRRVFNNIVKNALACQNGGSINISIYARAEEYGINLSIAISDEGPGIKQEDINRAYYGRFEGSNKNNRQEGLKLGLAISNGLIRFMNGFIMFRRLPETGTTVTITIPQKVIDKEYWKETGSTADNESDTLDLSGYKILVVDDDYMNLNVAKKMLSVYGGEVKTVDSGFSGLELCKNEKFDMIFMDHMMPEMDGIDTYRAIKSHPASKNKDTLFVALTANTVSGARDMFLSEGFFDFVSKPIDRKSLEHAIHRVIRDSLPRAESITEPDNQDSMKALDKSDDSDSIDVATKNMENSDSTEAAKNMENSDSTEAAKNMENSDSTEATKNMKDSNSTEAQENSETPDSVAVSEKPGDDKLNILASCGVNINDALTYCAGSEEFYFMMLSDFGGQIEDKINELSGYMEAADEDNYRIKIHALKSNTKTLGFDELSEMARLSESACKEGRFQEARESHFTIMDRLRETEALINRIK